MIDTHCHLTFAAFAGRVDQVLADARAVGVRGAITVATTAAECAEAQQLAHAHNGLWFTAGVHPLSAADPRNWDDVKVAAADDKCVAWGELGLDGYHAEPPLPLQRELLGEQLTFIESCRAEGLTKPIVVHCRDTIDELLDVFGSAPFDTARYVFHCFTGTADEARRVLDFGAWISFTGVVTFKNAKAVAEAAKLVPDDRIMVETDAPFLSPEPVRRVHPNEPKHVVHTARFLAGLRDVEFADFERRLDANAERFFGLALPN